jgi:hypothetical protein
VGYLFSDRQIDELIQETPSLSENISAFRRTDGISRSGNFGIAVLRASVTILTPLPDFL